MEIKEGFDMNFQNDMKCLDLKLFSYQIDELVQERRNSIADTLELHLSCTNPSKCG